MGNISIKIFIFCRLQWWRWCVSWFCYWYESIRFSASCHTSEWYHIQRGIFYKVIKTISIISLFVFYLYVCVCVGARVCVCVCVHFLSFELLDIFFIINQYILEYWINILRIIQFCNSNSFEQYRKILLLIIDCKGKTIIYIIGIINCLKE